VKPEYYKPSEIHYNKSQVLWLLRNVLFHDSWPSDGMETGYSGGKGQTSGNLANFETVRMIIGELNARLKLCGIAGMYLEYLTLIDYGDRIYLLSRLAGYTGVTPKEVDFQAGMALRFCKGRSRKLMTFERYCIRTKSEDNARKRRNR